MKREHTSNVLALYPISPCKHNPQIEINLPSVFAAGEIATGFAEMANAVKGTVEYICPGKKVGICQSSFVSYFLQKTNDN